MAKRTTKRMFIMLGLVVVLILILAGGFALHIKKLIASAPKPGPQTITAATVGAEDWQPQLNSVGSLVAVHGVDISSEVSGQVRAVNFKSGQNVQAGDLLVQLNADTDMAQLTSLQAAAELSAVTLKRDQAQLAVQGVSQAQIDTDTADLKSRRALVEQQVALVAKKTIRAPFAGQLGISTVNPGLYVNPGDKIVTLQQIDPIFVDFYLPQRQAGQLALGQSVTLSSDAAGGKFSGKLTAISPKVDPSTRNVQVEATIANPGHKLLPGMFANTSVDVGAMQHFLTLPQTAVIYNPYGSTVFIIKPATAKKDDKGNVTEPPPGGLEVQQAFVTTGETRGDQVAILSGLNAGDRVVTSGQIKLKNGTLVTIDNSVVPANSPNPTPQEH